MQNAASPEECDNEYDAYRKRMMLAYRFRPNPLVHIKILKFHIPFLTPNNIFSRIILAGHIIEPLYSYGWGEFLSSLIIFSYLSRNPNRYVKSLQKFGLTMKYIKSGKYINQKVYFYLKCKINY